MQSINKFLLILSVIAFSAVAQAEGVSVDDIERGNHPAIENADF